MDLDPRAPVAIDAVNAAFGRHEGKRAVHAKGVVLSGSFTATPEASGFSRATLFAGDPVPVVARFSNASGNPGHPDTARDGRGLAVKFMLPDGSRTDIVAVTLPSFLVRNPDDFIAFTRASKPGPRLLLFLARHRESWPAVRAAMSMKPPSSYATLRYNALHAFWWINSEGARIAVRYSWIPSASSPPSAGERSANYLQEEIATRLPVQFTLSVQIAAEGDPINDPTAAWPSSRQQVAVGTLTLDALDDTREVDGHILVFDPTRVTDGIELSDDLILRFRSDAYAESVLRRTGVMRS